MLVQQGLVMLPLAGVAHPCVAGHRQVQRRLSGATQCRRAPSPAARGDHQPLTTATPGGAHLPCRCTSCPANYVCNGDGKAPTGCEGAPVRSYACLKGAEKGAAKY
jgi:hypothetical protein